MVRWTLDQAERELVAWTAAARCRDEVITAARRAGLAKSRIHEITGIARTTIDRILEERPVRSGFMQMASREELANFLHDFTHDWPRDPMWSGAPFAFRPQVAMAYQVTAEQVAERLLAEVGFRALRLGSLLNTPDGELMASAVELLTPPPYQADMELLVEALKLAAKTQQSEERDKAFGVGVVAAIGAVLFSASRS